MKAKLLVVLLLLSCGMAADPARTQERSVERRIEQADANERRISAAQISVRQNRHCRNLDAELIDFSKRNENCGI